MKQTCQERLQVLSFASLWLFAAVSLLSITLQNALFFGLLAWAAMGGWRRGHRALLWSLPFLGWALLASFLSENAAHSLNTYKRWLLLCSAWYASGALRQEEPCRAVLGALLFFSALWCLGASLMALWGPFSAWADGEPMAGVLARWPETGSWRASSASGGYMILGTGSMLLLCYFTALVLEGAERFRSPLALLCLGSLALALLLTQTRSAWLGALAGTFGLLLWKRPRWALLASLALALLALLPMHPLRQRLAQGLDMRQDSTRERVYMAQAGISIIRAYPWLGVGDAMQSWDGKPGFYRRHLPEGAQYWHSTRHSEHSHLHNNAIQLAAMYGLPGLLLLLLFFMALFRQAWRLARADSPLARGCGAGFLAAGAAWWVNGIFEYNFGSFQSSFLLWFLTGLTLAQGKA